MWKDKLTLMSKQKQKRNDDLHLISENTNISNSINDYPEEEEYKREFNKHSQPQNVLSCTESDLTDVKIVEDLNPPKEPAVIDLTEIDDEKECDFRKQD